MVRVVTLKGGEAVPALGQGTWNMGEASAQRAEEIAAVRLGVELGLTLIDTAEMYGNGRTEELLAEALSGLRNKVFLVSKAYPKNASRTGLAKACEASLRRLKTDRLDLYLLHWRGSIRLAETVEGMEALQNAGKIRHWGVSNFDVADMEELEAAGGGECAVNQVLYNLTRRGPEFDLVPWLKKREMHLMAYTPIEQGRVPVAGPLTAVAKRHGVTPLQIALAWVLRDPDTIAIPKAGKSHHVRENRQALDIRLSSDDLAALDRVFKPPRRKISLEML